MGRIPFFSACQRLESEKTITFGKEFSRRVIVLIQNSRGDKAAIELYFALVRGWEPSLLSILARLADGNAQHRQRHR
jgi:hypothetical protein